MEILTWELVGTPRFQVAELLVRAVVLPSTVAVLPTNPSAWVDWAVCCSETSDVNSSLVLSCCSTPANCTSCWVNWLVSSGLSGFWFCNCVVSSVRNVWKFPASVAPVVELSDAAELDEDEVFVVPETTGLATFAVVVTAVPSNSDVHPAARPEYPAVAAADDRGRGDVLFADDQPMGVGIGLAA